jgi:hypothetical protein
MLFDRRFLNKIETLNLICIHNFYLKCIYLINIISNCVRVLAIFLFMFLLKGISTEEIVTVEKYDLVTEEMEIKKSNLVTALPYIAKEYKISFDLFVTKHITDA